jgi:ABC transporter, phosphonate, periplasmic substrate-binding protein
LSQIALNKNLNNPTQPKLNAMSEDSQSIRKFTRNRSAISKPKLRKQSLEVSQESKKSLKSKKSNQESKQTHFLYLLIDYYFGFFSILGLAVISFLGFKYLQFKSKSIVSVDALKIGILTEPREYKALQIYLEDELVVNNYWRFLQGDRLNITINGDKTLKYEEAKKRIEKQDWDIAFTYSPMISIAAKENNYSYVARMFPESQSYYRSALFVKRDSKIKDIANLISNNAIALGSIRSASGFFVPLYDLYGKTLTIKTGNSNAEIIKMVESGTVDIGATIFNRQLKQNPRIRIIRISRDIPGAGVYISARLSKLDQIAIAKVLLNVPAELQKNSNYGAGIELNYKEFTEITNKVNPIVKCLDFSKSPVRIFCSKK